MSGNAALGVDAGALTLGGTISAGTSTLTLIGAGTTNINGNIDSQTGGVTLAGGGPINVAGNIDLGSAGNIVDSGSGPHVISGVISGSAASTTGFVQGLTGTFFNLPYGDGTSSLIYPDGPGNSSWLGNQTPVATAQLVGPLDFPDIANNGFADSAGNPAYFNLGAGNNNNVEARWYGDILIPGTGTAPVPVTFSTTSDDGSMLYIDGNVVVFNDYNQGATQRTGVANLTPGLHAFDVEYYQGGGGASLDVQWDPSGGNNLVDIPNSAFVEPVNGLAKTGSGTLTLTNANSYSGSTVIDSGTLIVTANAAMGPASAAGVVVNSGGALAFGGGVDYTTAEPITINGSGPAGNGAIENISGANVFAAPITLSSNATIGSDAGVISINSKISTGANTLSLVGAGLTTINGDTTSQGFGGVNLAGSGAVTISGKVNLGALGSLVDSGSGQDVINGVISGTASSGYALAPGLIGTYYNLPASPGLIQPGNPGNPSWLGNQPPAAIAQLVGPLDFPDITDNGFADSLGNPTYYNLGGGNTNVEARWYGVIDIPGSGTSPTPIDFATTSDNGSILSIDGNVVVDNNNAQSVAQATGVVNLTPGFHTIDVEYYYHTGGGAVMDAQWDPTGGNNFVDIPASVLSSLQPVNGLEKTGAGTLTLTNANTYSGLTTIDAGVLIVTANGAMGSDSAAGVVVNPGGALGLEGGVNYTTTEPISLSGSGPAGNGAIENISGTNVLASAVTLSGPAVIGSDAGALTLGGTISTGANNFTVVGAGATNLNGNITSTTGIVTLDGSGAIDVAGNIDLGSGGGLVDSGSGPAAISGTINGEGVEPANSLTVSGAGALTLSNMDAYSGPTTVSAGELVVNGNVLNSAITVNAGGTLSGDGSVANATIESGGFFEPGNSPGVLSATHLSLANGASFLEQLGGALAGTQYDQTVVPAGGTTELNGATLNIAFLDGFQPTVGQQFTLIKNLSGGVLGTFSQGESFTSNGYIFGINYAGGAGHDVVLTALAQTTTKLSASTSDGATNTSLFGQSVTLTATVTAVSGVPTGAVVFEDGSTVLGTVPLSQGSASLNVSTLGVGSHSITASYTGAGGWVNSADSLTQTVNQDSTSTNIALSSKTPVLGQSVIFTATVSPIAPGEGFPRARLRSMSTARRSGAQHL